MDPEALRSTRPRRRPGTSGQLLPTVNRSALTRPPATPAALPRTGSAHLNLVRVFCTQVIVWHHLAFYGPMSDVVLPHAEALIQALYEQGRMVVQVFLVMGGFLAARSMVAGLRQPERSVSLPRLIWRRYLRLVPPMLLALALAVVCAAIARQLMSHDATPDAPTWNQLATHALLVHNLLGFEGLSAGVWYIAIDFQLYALLAAWTAGCHWAARTCGGHALTWFWSGVAALTVVSLLWFNLQPELDVWAVYFFGAYGLGALAAGLSGRHGPRRDAVAVVILGGLLVLALLLEWRDRILLAGLTAVALAMTASRVRWPTWMQGDTLHQLTRISYAQFLVHYPVGLLVNGAVTRLWPEDPLMNALGMGLAWLASLGAAVWFQGTLDHLGTWRTARLPTGRTRSTA